MIVALIVRTKVKSRKGSTDQWYTCLIINLETGIFLECKEHMDSFEEAREVAKSFGAEQIWRSVIKRYHKQKK